MDATILIVDDDPHVSEALSVVLADEGYAVATASNGREALAFLHHRAAPRVILLDLMMPVMDGYQFLEQRRADETLSAIPVVVLTAGALDERIGELAVSDCLRKPLDLDALLATIGRYAPRPRDA